VLPLKRDRVVDQIERFHVRSRSGSQYAAPGQP
jgi:hypothetical protein